MKKRNLDDILNECIERIISGETVEACLADYPEHAAELEPLLRTAQDTLKAAAITPRPEYRQRAAYEFQTTIRNLKPEKHGFFRWQARWVTVASAVIVILLAGGGTVAASSNALPDNPLYAVKLATENVRLALTTSALGKAELYAEFADRRVDEIIRMADKGDAARVEKATERMNDQLLAMANLALPVTDADLAGEETPALMAAPAAEATEATAGTAQDSNLGPAPVSTPELKAVAVPAPEPTDNQTRASLSANVTAVRIPAKQELQVERAPVAAATRALETEATAKRDKIRIKNSADLRTVVAEQAAENAQELEDALERVPDSVKSAVEWAIEVAKKGYENALKNIGR